MLARFPVLKNVIYKCSKLKWRCLVRFLVCTVKFMKCVCLFLSVSVFSVRMFFVVLLSASFFWSYKRTCQIIEATHFYQRHTHTLRSCLNVWVCVGPARQKIQLLFVSSPSLIKLPHSFSRCWFKCRSYIIATTTARGYSVQHQLNAFSCLYRALYKHNLRRTFP